MRKRRLELRRERHEKLEQDRRRRFLQMRQEEADLKKKVNDQAKEILRREKDAVKKLTSTLRFSEVNYRFYIFIWILFVVIKMF